MLESYVKLGIAALLPVVASVLIVLIDRKSYKEDKKNATLRQIIIGVVFGILAIIGTEWGIPMNGAMVNCRDAAVICAGLLFGGPAGIIAGIIGGVERWIAVAWGVGTFTRVACSVSTIIAGFYAALCRKLLFQGKRPIWTVAFAAGVVMEVFHLMMVFLTNMAETDRALAVVQACTVPMILGNGISVMLATLAVRIAEHKHLGFIRGKHTPLSVTMQRWLIVVVIATFIASTTFAYVLKSGISENDIRISMQQAAEDIANDISDASDQHMIQVAKATLNDIEHSGDDLLTIAQRNDLSEINIVNQSGTIIDSTNKDFLLFSMYSGEQSAEFMCLVNDNVMSYVQAYGPISYDTTQFRKYAGVVYKDGFIQIGYDASAFQKEINNQVTLAARNRHIGQTGVVLITNDIGSIVSGPSKFIGNSLAGLHFSKQVSEAESNVLYEDIFQDEKCYYLCYAAEGYKIITIEPVSEAMHLRNIAVYANSFMQVVIFAVLFALVLFFIQSKVVKNVQKINGYLSDITAGNLDTVVDVYTNEEFTVLSDGTNHTVNAMKGFIKEAEERINAELDFAKNIQHSVLPNDFPPFAGYEDYFDIYASMYTAKEVGGDFYDFYLVNKNILSFVVADVSGKGIPAALFMMRAKTQLKNLTENHLPLDEVFVKGNNGLCEGNDANMFVTTWQAKFNFAKNTMLFVNAGHNPPLIKRANGQFEYVRIRKGLVLGAMADIPYKSHEIEFNPGDTIFLYTDGVTEATDAHDELYGEDRLLKILNSREFNDMNELCDTVKADVDLFVGDAPQFDDITMLALRFKKQKEEA